jgi:hypothetical protein
MNMARRDRLHSHSAYRCIREFNEHFLCFQVNKLEAVVVHRHDDPKMKNRMFKKKNILHMLKTHGESGNSTPNGIGMLLLRLENSNEETKKARGGHPRLKRYKGIGVYSNTLVGVGPEPAVLDFELRATIQWELLDTSQISNFCLRISHKQEYEQSERN